MSDDTSLWFASLYARDAWDSDSKVRWVDGPYELEHARSELDRLVAAELALQSISFEDGRRTGIVYYELRGIDGCPVRYRVWIERPAPFARVEVLQGIGYHPHKRLALRAARHAGQDEQGGAGP